MGDYFVETALDQLLKSPTNSTNHSLQSKDQQFQSSSATTPVRTGSLGGAGGGNDRSFNFNLAGQNQQNQILQAIQEQFSQPVQAYVVSGDITNQQQLDADILGAASF